MPLLSQVASYRRLPVAPASALTSPSQRPLLPGLVQRRPVPTCPLQSSDCRIVGKRSTFPTCRPPSVLGCVVIIDPAVIRPVPQSADADAVDQPMRNKPSKW